MASVIGEGEECSRKALIKGLRRELGLRGRLRHSARQVEEGIVSLTPVHHPMWVARILSYADRPPFPPKVRPNIVFVDAVSGYRGVMESVPPMSETGEQKVKQVAPRISTAEHVREYVQAALRTVNRSYVMKKPRHEIEELKLAYLPLQRVRLRLDGQEQQVWLNGNTGEPETFLASLWKTGTWHDVPAP